MTPVQDIGRAVDAARAARQRLRDRPLRETAASLAAAARAWADDAALRAALPGPSRLAPAMIDAVVPRAAAALDADAMLALADRERGDAPGPALVAHVLASNVPALALPAIALGCLAGAAVLVKSGRQDPVSAPAFQRALAAVDPDLAATVVCAYWPGGRREYEEPLLGAADVVVASGGDATMLALRRRLGRRLIAHGSRWSLAAVTPAGDADADRLATLLARDVALHDQRGCLSPHVVCVVGDAEAFADRLVRALAAVRRTLPPGPATLEERAAVRLAVEEAAWAGSQAVRQGLGGTALVESWADTRPGPGGRVVRVCPLESLDALPATIRPGTVECVALHGDGLDPRRLAERGVARVCAPGRMQEPPLAWARGQRAALGSLIHPHDETPHWAVEDLAA